MKNRRMSRIGASPGIGRSLWSWVTGADIRIVSILPILVSLFLLGAFLWLGEKILGPPVTPRMVSLGTTLAAVVASMSGVVQLLRSEIPGPFGGSVRGPLARILGWLLAIACWIVALISLFSALFADSGAGTQ